MIRLIGARWKYREVWSRSVLIGPSPFYVLDLASNRCLNTPCRFKIFTPYGHQLSGRLYLVPIALGKYLFSFRTQKSSPVAPIILRKWETRKVPNYGLDFLERKSSKELYYKKRTESEFRFVFCFLLFNSVGIK